MARTSNREILWHKVAPIVFQDRGVSYEKWSRAILDPSHSEHFKMLTQSIRMLKPAIFVELLGEGDFVSRWSELRTGLNEARSIVVATNIYDSVWATLATGYAFVKPLPTIRKPLSKGLQSTFVEISRHSKPVNVYQVAKDVGRAYNRIHQDVSKLESLGLVESEYKRENNRNLRLVRSCAY